MWALPTRWLPSKLPGTSSSFKVCQLVPLPGGPSWKDFLGVLHSHLRGQGSRCRPWGGGVKGMLLDIMHRGSKSTHAGSASVHCSFWEST